MGSSEGAGVRFAMAKTAGLLALLC